MSFLEALPPNALIDEIHEGLCDLVHFLTGKQLMKLILFNYLIWRKLACVVRFPRFLGGGLPKLIDIWLRNSNPAIYILDKSQPGDVLGLFVEVLDIFWTGDDVDYLPCYSN